MGHVKALFLHSPTGFIFSGRNHKGVECGQIGQDGLVLFLQPGKCIHPFLPMLFPGLTRASIRTTIPSISTEHPGNCRSMTRQGKEHNQNLHGFHPQPLSRERALLKV
jgi:hypothetical protein